MKSFIFMLGIMTLLLLSYIVIFAIAYAFLMTAVVLS